MQPKGHIKKRYKLLAYDYLDYKENSGGMKLMEFLNRWENDIVKENFKILIGFRRKADNLTLVNRRNFMKRNRRDI